MDFEVRDLHKFFGENHVLRGLNFKAQSGKAFGLLGRNGAGKTTTIRIIMGVFPANSGTVLMGGKAINRKKLNMGYLPEEHGLYPKKKILEQLVYFSALRGKPKAQALVSINRWAKRLEMEKYLNQKLETLSKGNQQKIQMVAALMTDPDFIILDEPFSGLDPVNASILKEVVKELIADGKLVFFSSHQMNYVEEFCESVAIIKQGEIVIDGRIEDIKRGYDRNIVVVKSRQFAAIQQYTHDKLSEFVTATRLEEGALYMTLKEEKMKNKLMMQLAGQNFDMDTFQVYEPTLSDIFVEYTKESNAPDEEKKEAVGL